MTRIHSVSTRQKPEVRGGTIARSGSFCALACSRRSCPDASFGDDLLARISTKSHGSDHTWSLDQNRCAAKQELVYTCALPLFSLLAPFEMRSGQAMQERGVAQVILPSVRDDLVADVLARLQNGKLRCHILPELVVSIAMRRRGP